MWWNLRYETEIRNWKLENPPDPLCKRGKNKFLLREREGDKFPLCKRGLGGF